MRLSRGMSAKAAARADRLPAVEVERLLETADFKALIAAYRDLMALSEEERCARLTLMAWHVLEDALEAGDPMVALFVLQESHAGRSPAKTLVDGVFRAFARAGRTPEDARTPPRAEQPAPEEEATPAPPAPRRPDSAGAPLRGAKVRLVRGLAVEAGLDESAAPISPPQELDAAPAAAAEPERETASQPSAPAQPAAPRRETPPRRPTAQPAPKAAPKPASETSTAGTAATKFQPGVRACRTALLGAAAVSVPTGIGDSPVPVLRRTHPPRGP